MLKPGDTYAITFGEPMGYPGGTNMLKIVPGWRDSQQSSPPERLPQSDMS